VSNNVFDFVNAISYNKTDLLTEGTHSPKDYIPFIVNKAMSNFPDTVLHANEMNMHRDLGNDQQFYYLLHSIRKGKRFGGRWAKAVKSEELEAVKQYYKLNNQKALVALELLSTEEKEMIKKRVQHGGEQGGKG
jgi:hypothetical protein